MNTEHEAIEIEDTPGSALIEGLFYSSTFLLLFLTRLYQLA